MKGQRNNNMIPQIMPFMPNNIPSMMMPNFMNDNYNILENKVNNLEKKVKVLENRISRLENPYQNNNTQYQTPQYQSSQNSIGQMTYQTTQSNNAYNGEMYMM